MSKLSLAALVIAAALIVLAVIFDVAFFRNGSGVILLVGLGYAYTVAKREVNLLNYAVQNREESTYSAAEARKAPPVPQGVG